MRAGYVKHSINLWTANWRAMDNKLHVMVHVCDTEEKNPKIFWEFLILKNLIYYQ